ncbi:hypothetical protein HCN44_002758 [Aphidius gifuensis]|uniref:Nucleolar 27S pre-rRNA processing Urb2/Npa2 C-terminal domain-containing protein n=1 Tax=Aphidius gifuensis TaxID=684658 RepID=A0A834XQV6_APHGI|nr:uncharacterized protein LOC122854406 [Aphidius gifuensis]KAF7991196.1 hypothetical protein HCN44_002758 [Aphidius gifuensis]
MTILTSDMTKNLDTEDMSPQKKRQKLTKKTPKKSKTMNKQEEEEKMDCQDDIKEPSLSDIQDKLITTLLTNKKIASSEYDSLAEISKQNPLLIEKQLSEIFKRILLEKKTTIEDKQSYEQLMIEIFDACVRLRRDKKLISSILVSLNDSLMKSKIIDFNVDDIVPKKFTDKFTLSMRNMTNQQVASVAMSFNYHISLIPSNSSSITNQDVVVLAVTTRLFIIFIEGVPIADNTWLLPVQKKFISILMDFGKTLLSFIDKIKNTTYDEKINIYILSMTENWQILIDLFKHYSPDAVTNDNIKNVNEIIKTITKNIDDNTTTRKYKFFCKFEENRICEKKNLFHKLLKNDTVFNDIDDFGEALINQYPHGVLHLDNLQLKKLSNCLLKNLTTIDELISCKIVRNNRNFVTALILELLNSINSVLPDDCGSISKKLINKIDGIDWWDDESSSKIFKYYKKQLTKPEWSKIDESDVINNCLKNLLSLPLMYCQEDLKELIFLLMFTFKNEFPDKSESRLICIKILHDISESCTFDILKYIPLNVILEDLSAQSELIITKILESALTNYENLETLKSLIKENPDNIKLNKTSIKLIEVLDKIKSKIKLQDVKDCLTKIDKKLQKIIRNNMNDDVDNADKLKRLTLVIKYTVTQNNKFDDDELLQAIHSALNLLIGDNKIDGLESTKEGQQFIKIVLHNKSNGIVLDNVVVKNIWTLMLKKSSEDIIPSLIEATDSKILGVVLNSLKKQTFTTLKKINNENEELFNNCLLLWNLIAKADMGSERAKVRQAMINMMLETLKTSTVPYENSRDNVIILITSIVASKHMHINEKIIDNILFVINNIIDESINIDICYETLKLCSGFLRHRINMIADRLPCFLILFKKLINYTINQSRIDMINQHKITLLTIEINKISSALIKMKKDFARLSPYFIGDLIKIYADGVIPFYVKESIDETVGLYLSICDHHAISLLSRVLPSSMQEIFKNLYANYKKFNKFTGKI